MKGLLFNAKTGNKMKGNQTKSIKLAWKFFFLNFFNQI